ncbi:MAG: HNH endonuclease [Thermomicrobiales bacterium]
MATVLVPLTQGKFAFIDAEDAPRVLAHAWCLARTRTGFYAQRRDSSTRRPITLHMFLTEAPPGIEVDHKNGDGLDNRRENLRLATRQQNAMNTPLRADNKTGYKGVSEDKRRGGYRASIRVNGKQISIGRFDDPRNAALAYDAYARTYFGEFGTYNFPQEGERGVLAAREGAE